MKNPFNAQLQNSTPLTAEELEKLPTKTYFDGSEIKVGDKPLYALLSTGLSRSIENGVGRTEGTLKVVPICERHFSCFLFHERECHQRNDNTIPTLCLIDDENAKSIWNNIRVKLLTIEELNSKIA